jgi:hypothetical protein
VEIVEAPTPSAACAIHPERTAQGTCERCGNYACELCSEAGQQGMCPTCRARLGLVAFPLSRDRWSVEGLLGYGWHVFKREWQWLVVGMLILLGITYGMAFGFVILQAVVAEFIPRGGGMAVEMGLTVASQVVQIVIGGWLQLGFMHMCFEALGGQPVRIGMLFARHRQVWKLMVQYLLLFGAFLVPIGGIAAVVVLADLGRMLETWHVGLIIGIALVLAVPALYVLLGFAFMQSELAFDERVGPIEAMRRSWVMMRGYRWWTLLVGFLVTLVASAGVVACCVGLIPTMALGFLLFAAWYLTLRSGADFIRGAPAQD